MSADDSARAWGELFGSIVVPFLVGAIIYGVGAYVASRRAEASRRRTRRGFLVAAIAVTALGLVVTAANLAKRGAGDADEQRLAGFYSGVGNGCAKRCHREGYPEAQCKPLCACIVAEVRQRVPRADALRIARSSMPDPKTDPAAPHFAAASTFCVQRHPLTR